MNKTVYIGEVPQEYLEMGDVDSLFERGGHYYYYILKFDLQEGCAQLVDTCGRMMPLDMSNYAEIAAAMDAVATFQEEYEDLQEQMAEFMDEVPSEMRVIPVDDLDE